MFKRLGISRFCRKCKNPFVAYLHKDKQDLYCPSCDKEQREATKVRSRRTK